MRSKSFVLHGQSVGLKNKKGSKVVMMDEATASIDEETEILIMKAIKDNFSDCTVLTIAHRMNTVIKSDQLISNKNCCASYRFNTRAR